VRYTSSEIATIAGLEQFGSSASHTVTSVCTDSRKLTNTANALFVAIAGTNHDGHKYLNDLYAQGVRTFLIEKKIPVHEMPEAVFLLANKAIEALQKLAAHHRAQFQIPVIGITGSNGKTVVKEWLNQLLSDDYVIVRSPKSYNSQLGVALSVLNMESFHQMAIFEAGISHPGEMDALQKVIQPTLGIFVNLGQAHRENFSSSAQLAVEKSHLFQHTSTVIYSTDYPEIQQSLGLFGKHHEVTWSQKNGASLQLTKLSKSANSAQLDTVWQGKRIVFSVPFSDPASIENVLCCVATALHLGISPDTLNTRLTRLSALPMRLELLNGANMSVIINDTYSSDLHSLEIALDFSRKQSPGKKHVAILSDIYQSGIPVQELHQKVAALLAEKGISELIGIGPEMKANSELYNLHARFFASTEDFLKAFELGDFQHSVALIKGARAFRFEQIVERLQEQTHDTVLEIDLNAMAHNLHYFRSKLKPGVRLMVMVKAFGYGSGSHEVASLLEFNKADYLAVAYTDEGIALRESGISLPIVVMNPERSSLDGLIRYHLQPEIYSMRTLHLFEEALKRNHVKEAYPVHIKIDTGMHRLGFEESETSDLVVALKNNTLLKVESVFTHLAASDEPAHDDFTRKQLSLLKRTADEIEQLLGYGFMRHAGNTGAIQRFEEAQLDMVRLGIGLYGVSALEEEQVALKTVSTLRTVISQIKNIPAGDSVGYSRSFVAKEHMRIATIPLGYADGLRRSLSNGKGKVWIAGKPCPIVGKVCMDMTMVDVSQVNCSEGDEVIVFGRNASIAEFAKSMDTIAYEVLTSVPQRVKRVYLQE
jgi:alanine racemase